MKGIITPISIFISIILIGASSYLLIDNFINPNGYAFEGAVLGAIGVNMLLISIIIASLNKTIDIFSNIFEQQTTVQETLLKNLKGELHTINKLTTIKPLDEGMMKGDVVDGSVIITDMDTGEIKEVDIPGGKDEINRLKNLIINAMNNQTKKSDNNLDKSLDNMSINELEIELSNAILIDNFEQAEKIKQQIEKIKNKDSEN